MKQLLNSKNLLAEKRVVAAYKALVNRSPGYCSHQPASSYCDVCGVPGSLADVAFEMRDACDIFVWYGKLMQICGSTIQCRKVTKEQWIIAAVKAWEAKQ